MKKIKLEQLTADIPSRINFLFDGALVYDSSCSPEARVYYVERDGGYYVKSALRGTLALEADMTRYYHSIGLGVEVVDYLSEESDWLVTRAAVGADCTDARYLEDPMRLAVLLGESLRALHERGFSRCPVQNRIETYDSAVRDNYEKGRFDRELFWGEYRFDTPRQAYEEYMNAKNELTDRVLLHGDYCLPNVILDDWRVSAFIDVGNGGVGDRHIDLFWGVWTLNFNLKTNKYKDIFLDAYGRDKANERLLRAIAAAETFG